MRESEKMMDRTQPVRALFAAWAALDIDAMMAQFAEDAVFENVPMEVIVGKQAIRTANTAFIAQIKAAPWKIREIGVLPSGTVMTEREDIFDLKDDRRVSIRVMGAFEVDEDNLITQWRDYFDLADWNRQMNMDPDFGRRQR